MLATFTQTYGDNRNIIYSGKNLDIGDIFIRKNIPINFYSFHNTQNKGSILSNNYFKEINFNIIEYNNINFPETLKQTLHYLKKQNIKKVLLLQDDVFCSIQDISLLKDFLDVLNTDYECLNLELSFDFINSKQNLIRNINKINNTFTVHEVYTHDYKPTGFFPFDDGPCLASVDFLLNEVYDDDYFAHDNIWDAENYLNRKFCKREKILRPVLNIPVYRRYNIVGKNYNINHVHELNNCLSKK